MGSLLSRNSSLNSDTTNSLVVNLVGGDKSGPSNNHRPVVALSKAFGSIGEAFMNSWVRKVSPIDDTDVQVVVVSDSGTNNNSSENTRHIRKASNLNTFQNTNDDGRNSVTCVET